jgi:hypothetical protein
MQLELDLDTREIEALIVKMGNQSVLVYVDPTEKARKADLRVGKNGGRPRIKGLKSNKSIDSNYIDKRRGIKQPKVMLTEVAYHLDRWRGNKGMFSQAMAHADNADLMTLVNGFADRGKSKNQIKKMENAGRSIVRNQIIGKRLGANTQKRQIQKGFNRFGLSTGALFNAIKGKYTDGQ